MRQPQTKVELQVGEALSSQFFLSVYWAYTQKLGCLHLKKPLGTAGFKSGVRVRSSSKHAAEDMFWCEQGWDTPCNCKFRVSLGAVWITSEVCAKYFIK